MPRRTRRSAWTTRTDQVVSKPKRPRQALVPVLGLVGAGAVLLVVQLAWDWNDGRRELTHPGVSASIPQAGVEKPLVSEVAPLATDEGPVAQAPPEIREVRPPSAEEVGAIVDRQNAKSREQMERFKADGWTPVEIAPPDPAVIALDPSLLNGRERELRVHLETNALSDSQLENAQQIALEANETRTRFAAIQALGRSDNPRAQELLLQLFDGMNDVVEKRMILGHLRPQNLEDPSVDWIVEHLSAPHIDYDLKKQMTFSLVLADLAVSQGQLGQSRGLQSLLERVPAEWRQELIDTHRTLTRD